MKPAANKSIPRILIILYDICTLYLHHILQMLWYSMMVAFSLSLQIFNYLPIIAPDYHPFVNIKGMYCLLIWIFLPNTYHFEIVLLPDTIHEILFHSTKCRSYYQWYNYQNMV